MARPQTVKKKGRSSSSAKPAKGRKASSRPARADRPTEKGRVNQPETPTRKPGARGGDFDRDAGRPVRAGEPLEPGRQDLPELEGSSARGREPAGGREERDARARRAGLGFREEE
jgi:hypothetical protein